MQIEITEKQVFDFLRCPAYYDNVYNRKLNSFETNSVAKMLNNIAKFFYSNLMNGEVVPPSKLKTMWDKTCKKYSDYITPQKCLDGIGALMKLYNWAKKNELIITEMSKPYRIFLPGDKINVGYSGTIEVVAILKHSHQPTILVTDFNHKQPDQYLIDTKLKYTLDSLGYYETQNEHIGIQIHHVNTDKDFFAFRNQDDFKRMKTTIENIAYSISNEIFYPHENLYCTSCGMKYFCKGWH